jgi:two-component system chemotaxis sensor kinase CheA
MLKALLTVVEQALAGDGRMPIPDGYFELLDALANYDPARDAAGVTPIASRAVVDLHPSADAAPVAVAATQTTTSQSGDATIRVRTDRLDRLIDMVGELVIAQSMIAGDDGFHSGQQHELLRKVTHAGKIVRELQDLSMSMRMVPLRPTFQKLARVVRDTATKAGKTVQFVTEGDDVEIDRTMVDRLGDPLVHMVRNAVDHGVEPPQERTANGKPSLGVVRLHAYHASGNVVVELIDDGRGLHRDKIVKKAIEKGLIETDKGMSDSEVFNLVFAPGFSTAEKVTDISGRGVGMDVVRRNLEAIRGRIDITSTPGSGTTFAIRLPLTLAVTDGMLVRVGEERFIIPLTHIHMSFRPEPSMLSTVVGKGEMVLLRGELMPVVRLHRLFHVAGAVESPLDGLLMIVGDGRKRTALLVDDLLGQQQVVAKTLGDGLGKVEGVSGGAILGDGRVGLILDVNETLALAQSQDVGTPRREREAA